ncbi:MAG: prolipoprotein diacylglyceryl transferase [Treponema sp.]|nr:prolipoprotein diacylglyceryl transferase [Treponema sp.]
MLLSIPFPSWLKPEIIEGFPVRWYGVMYIFAFATAFLLYRKQVKERRFPMSDDNLSSLFFWGILALLLGARLFSTLIYHTDNTYWTKPWLIFWPFNSDGSFGLQGMSYHGGAFLGLIAVIIYAKVKRISFREIGDMFAASIPLGYTFGRIGNFINAELYGRVTDSPIGMVFPNAGLKMTSENESLIREIAEKTNIAISGTMGEIVNLPRHPSQLYEAIFEGIVLWGIIWFFRNRKPFKGFLVGLYFLGYGLFRFIIEYFREPDTHLGYRIELGQTTLPHVYPFSHPLLSFSTGQILCFFMMLFGIIWLIIASRMSNKEPIRIYGNDVDSKGRIKTQTVKPEEAAKERNQRRKMRKKLK